MDPSNERPERKKSRARVRPPATTVSPDPIAEEEAFASTSSDATIPDPLGAYSSAGGYAASTAYPVTGSPAEPVADYPTTSPYAEPPTTYQTVGGAAREHAMDAERTLELREEQLVARKEMREVGEVTIRTTIEEVPGRLEVEALREEVEIEHAPMGQIVTERVGPYEEDGVLVVPIYEEQLVVVKRLVLKEHLRVRRVASTEHQLFEDTLRRDRLVIEDPSNTHLVHEQFPADEEHADRNRDSEARAEHDEGGPLGQLMRKVLG